MRRDEALRAPAELGRFLALVEKHLVTFALVTRVSQRGGKRKERPATERRKRTGSEEQERQQNGQEKG